MSSPRRSPRRSARPRRSLSDQFRDAIVASGLSDHAIATEAGIDPGSFGRFLRAERSWTLRTAERVAEVLGLVLSHPGDAHPRRLDPRRGPGHNPARRDVDRRQHGAATPLRIVGEKDAADEAPLT